MTGTTTPNRTTEHVHPHGDTNPATEPSVEQLVAGARRGERWAWAALITRFRPLVRAVTSGYRLGAGDAEDVDQTVWMRLVENLGRIREPRAVPRWLLTTANHESLRLLRGHRRVVPMDPLAELTRLDPGLSDDLDADLLRRERAEVLRRGIAELPAAQRALLTLLTDDRPLSYREISAALDIPIGSIGPTRARGLARLRGTAPVRDYAGTATLRLAT